MEIKVQKYMKILIIAFVLFNLGYVTVFSAGPAIVNLGTAGNFIVLSKSGISTTGTTLLTGKIGVSPIDHTAMTGFSEVMDSSNTFSTSVYVAGKLYASDYTIPTPTYVGTAINDMQTAYTDASSRVADFTDSGVLGSCATTCDLSGLILIPGTYTFSGPGNLVITGDVTLNGGPNDIWIFKVPGTLNISSAQKVLLTGGALSTNIFWAVAGATTLGTNSTFEGNILEAGSVIALQTGAKLNGRALSQFAVTLDANTILIPGGSAPDTTSPVITMLGTSPISLNVGDTFTDSGATALDNIDGPVTVTTSGSVNTALAGSYTITYNASDTAGNIATSVTRTVNVSDPASTNTSRGGSRRHVDFIETPIVETSSTVEMSNIISPFIAIETIISTSTPVILFVPSFPDTGLPPMNEFVFSLFGMPIQESYNSYIIESTNAEIPSRLKIPKINVDASIESLGLASNGIIDTPKDHTNVAWFNGGPRPGEKGNAVINGHYGWINHTPAAFDNLYKLEKGDEIYIENEKGDKIIFIVSKIQIFKEGDDAFYVFDSNNDKTSLNLITCTGPWSITGQNYPERLVVFSDIKI